jgi:hypothetical protein
MWTMSLRQGWTGPPVWIRRLPCPSRRVRPTGPNCGAGQVARVQRSAVLVHCIVRRAPASLGHFRAILTEQRTRLSARARAQTVAQLIDIDSADDNEAGHDGLPERLNVREDQAGDKR